MADILKIKNVTCCSVELYWEEQKAEKRPNDNILYELYFKEDGLISSYKKIYSGDEIRYEAINLNPNITYVFKLKKMKEGKQIQENIKTVKTLNSPKAMLSENSVQIANGGSLNYTNQLSDLQNKLIKDCSKLIFEENDNNVIKGDFNGIEIKIAHESENNIYYISFDVKYEYLEKFFNEYIEGCEKNIIIPCHFVIKKLPTILVFNLLEKGKVILTGKRMGGAIASSLAFYILYIGKSLNKIYNNAFLEEKKETIGVITFGSPSFLTNLTTAVKMKELTAYFYNIKEEFDYIPEIIDLINQNQNYKDILAIFNKLELDNECKKLLESYTNLYFKENNFSKILKNDIKIPFGKYYMMNKKDNSLNSINELTFEEFYYYKIFHSKNPNSDLKIYEKLKSKIQFNKNALEYLDNKNYKLDYIKIIRRKIKEDTIKGIIKMKLIEFDHNNISPDVIKKIELISSNDSFQIYNEDIYYDNEFDITAYRDDLNEKIVDVIITNYFGGEIRVNHILNFQGSGPTGLMLKENIEKLFLIPFFKLFEIIYCSLNNKEKYNQLKQTNFGENFDELKILNPFETQNKIYYGLLALSRPDIVGKTEKRFIGLSEKYGQNYLNQQQMNYLYDKLKLFYKKALQLQKDQNINCDESQKDSVAQKVSFPQNIQGERKKLFMSNRECFQFNDFLWKDLDDSYFKEFSIKNLIKEVLSKIEDEIYKDISKLNDSKCKEYLNKNIGKLYNKYIIPNINFILMLILSTIEGGDLINFNHKFNWKKIKESFFNSIFSTGPNFISIFLSFHKYFEKDFETFYTKDKIEKINMKNLFFKTKTKNIVNSNAFEKKSDLNKIFDMFNKDLLNVFKKKLLEIFNTNKIRAFSEYSENEKIAAEYYENFLQLLNNYSNDFPEDIEISIYDNLKEENIKKDENYIAIKDMINDLINDEESKKGFLALVRQSFLIGKLRANIVSYFNYNYLLNL